MKRSHLQTAEELFDEAISAPEIVKELKASIPEKSQLYAGLYLLTFFSCIGLFFLTGWFRWVTGFFVVACLISSWSMRTTFARLRRAHIVEGSGSTVLANHMLLNALAIASLAYAFVAVWAGWSLTIFAVVIAAVINFSHFIGYKNSNGRV